MSVRIAPSILAADSARLVEEIARVEEAGADLIHVDVMDGHFVPNLSTGSPVIAALKTVTHLRKRLKKLDAWPVLACIQPPR